MSVESVNPLIFKARLAEQAERYDDMAEFMTQYVKEHGAVDEDGRNLLSVAYKNKIGTKRSSWRIVSAEESKSEDAECIAICAEYRAKIEQEIFTIHDTVVKLIDEFLLKNPEGSGADDRAINESKVFFNKMKGDYSRYKAEITTGNEKEIASESSLKAYETARDIADDELPTTHPMRLGLSLNFSVFHYEILNDSKKACQIAKEAFDNAIAHLDTVSEKDYKDSTLIMQLLRDNLTLWTADSQLEAPDDS